MRAWTKWNFLLTVAEVQQTWQAFLAHAASQEAAGELLFNAWWEAAPSLHSAFVSPQKVLHLRLFLGFNAVVANLGNPSALKIEAEQIAFRHLDRPVKPAFVDIFREAAVEMLEAELTPAHFNTRARVGWQALLNYLGGALCYVSREYSGRVKIILRSWRTANNITEEKEKDPEAEEDEAEEEEKEEEAAEAVTPKKSSSKDLEVTSETGRVSDGINLKERTGKDMKVPTTFKEMFLFNAAVMGFGNSNWMSIILEQFDAMVMNIANSHRLSEECDVLSLVLAKEDEASIHLVEFRSVMLATLRSLCPKDWDTDHEVAWNCVWENIERMLKALWGKPRIYQRSLDLFIAGLSEEEVDFFPERTLQDILSECTCRTRSLQAVHDQAVFLSGSGGRDDVRHVQTPAEDGAGDLRPRAPPCGLRHSHGDVWTVRLSCS